MILMNVKIFCGKRDIDGIWVFDKIDCWLCSFFVLMLIFDIYGYLIFFECDIK